MQSPGFLAMISDQLRMLSGPLFAALVGYFMRFADQAIRFDRMCWRRFVIESPSIIGFAIISAGAAEHFSLGYATTCALSAATSWFGNAAVMAWVKAALRRWRFSQSPKRKPHE